MSTFALSPLANIGIIRLQKDDIASSAEDSDRSRVRIWTTTEAVGFGKSLSRRQKQPDSPTRSGWKEGRGSRLVAKAGPPSNTTLIFAFVFPLSLLVITVLNAIRIADKLDEKFLEELAVNQAIMNEDAAAAADDDNGDGYGSGHDSNLTVLEEEASVPRLRNRPKRLI
ncbi:uncharacterized protein LOC116254517 [Nymphaea colorata]|nr:uncharacterized protein LOC116254517 [Nymphaea colorata]